MRRAAAILFALIGLACLPAVAAASGPPSIEYLSPHPLRNHEATVHFTVDPEGLETTYEVQYGSKAGEYFPYSYPWDGKLPAGDEPVAGQAAFPAYFEGQLTAGAQYHWRVVAENSAGKTEGPDEVFTTTKGSPPRTETLAATEQTTSSAVMHGSIYPGGAPVTRCWFQVVSERNLEQRGWVWHGALGEPILMGELVPCAETPEEIGTGLGPVHVHAAIADLEATPYEYRLGAANEFEDRWYSEPALIGPIWVKTQGADPVGASEAGVHGAIYKQYSGEAAYWVEYGIGGLGQKTGIGWLSALGREYEPEVTLPCLQPDSEYTYRFAALNAAGTVYGSEKTFHTAAGEPAGCSPSHPSQAVPTPPAASATSSKRHRHHKHHHRRYKKHRHHKNHR